MRDDKWPPAAHLLDIDEHNKILLVGKQRGGEVLTYILPGGKRDHQRESPQAALRREASEEVGVTLHSALVCLGDVTGITPNSRRRMTTRVFLGRALGELVAQNEIVDIRRVSLKEAEALPVSELTWTILRLAQEKGLLPQ